uniref:Uncharacterized protein n=1 Tax=Myoviridae sp. ct7CH26 TaxID=2827604 RepID=A0A8S5RTI4_9CAUD|nr:MAG TPA: hypothetical protein [Myoviridae sp. ct7CH26]
MCLSAAPLSYRVILVGMIGGAHLISVDHSVFTAFRLLGGMDSNNPTPNRRTSLPGKVVFLLRNSAYSDEKDVRQMGALNDRNRIMSFATNCVCSFF